MDSSKDAITIYVRGTGRNNHNNTIISINNQDIVNNGNFQGLVLAVIDRKTLETTEISYFNTYLPGRTTTEIHNVLEYYYNEDKSVSYISIEKEVEINNEYSEAQRLFDRISNLTERYMFVLASNYGWEDYMTNELIDLLASCGGLYINEFKNANLRKVQNNMHVTWEAQELITPSNSHHPYAFIGIPNLGSSKGFESIRSNKGNYLTTTNLPYAEIIARVKYNLFFKNYYFDDIRLGNRKLHYTDEYDFLWKAKDYSLKNLMPLIQYSNLTAELNLGFCIFDVNTKVNRCIQPQNSTQFSQTALERVILGDQTPAKRFDYSGNVYQNGIFVEDLAYYKYYKSIVKEGKECFENYNDFSKNECPDFSALNRSVPILYCRTGISPQLCPDNNNLTQLFPGYAD